MHVAKRSSWNSVENCWIVHSADDMIADRNCRCVVVDWTDCRNSVFAVVRIGYKTNWIVVVGMVLGMVVGSVDRVGPDPCFVDS